MAKDKKSRDKIGPSTCNIDEKTNILPEGTKRKATPKSNNNPPQTQKQENCKGGKLWIKQPWEKPIAQRYKEDSEEEGSEEEGSKENESNEDESNEDDSLACQSQAAHRQHVPSPEVQSQYATKNGIIVGRYEFYGGLEVEAVLEDHGKGVKFRVKNLWFGRKELIYPRVFVKSLTKKKECRQSSC